MNRILIPTDFSENSWNAIFYGLSFFQNEKVVFHLLHINTVKLDVEFSKNKNNCDFVKSTAGKFSNLLEKINKSFPDHNYSLRTVSLHSFFTLGIKNYINEQAVDLIIMGTKGATNLNEINVGSHTWEVITKVKCPILVIPEKARFKVPVNIGFPTDFNVLYRSKIVSTLQQIAQKHDTAIKILRVAQSQKPLDSNQIKNREYLSENLTGIPHSFHVIENPNLEIGLQSFISNMNIDIIAMLVKNLNLVQRIIFKPTSEQTYYHNEIPFLALHE